MITWLFTQVWLWSLAAFLLGALVTWALFVRPLRRRLEEELARPHHSVHDETLYDEPVHEDDDGTERFAEQAEHQPAPLELLDQPRQWEEPEEPQFEEWDRRPRPWVAPEATRTTAAETHHLPEPEQEPETDNTWFRNPEVEETRVEPRPSQFPPGADEEEDSGQLSGQLRSLFEPESAGDAQEPCTPPVGADATQVIPSVPAEQEQSSPATDGSDETPAGAPLPKRTPQSRGEPTRQVDLPQIPDALRRHVENGRPLPQSDSYEDPAEITLVEDSSPLPRRTPGAGPHPGRDSTWEQRSEAPAKSEPEPATEAEPTPPAAAASSAPATPQGGSSGTGPMIKGHSASRQYHTPDSPQYDQITADVWFRTPSDAEIAGFAPWHADQPRN
ncbi:hypothetical protein EIL87_25550 [Saccharopolyspora rhizosphaerae]|uniref:LapA family protein n=1 Tax=Saccharopolyspora rhizosphaerae TaxID=2492662 RepID=A0A3R8PVR8_9PSEU|nr:hypothetical protein [Saccharopolyspora rhizosphaerae]RRO13023.1 hypothetical protein EIL87_25550 [Saccharopolyspora rhizosphaerae]